MQLGNLVEDQTISFTFTSRAFATGVPTVLTAGAVSIYKDGNTTQTTVGVTLTASFDSVVGLNHVSIDTSADAFYVVGADYHVVLTAGTVGGTSVVGETLAHFSIENRFKEVDLVAINGSAQSAADLKDFADDGYDPATNKVQGVVLVDTVTALAANSVNASALATDAVTELQTGLATSAALATVQADTDNIQTRLPAALVSGRMDSSVGAVASNAITATALDATAGAEIADAVWDEVLAGHLTAGTTGAALSSAGSAGDPWTTALPGAYGAGTAGFIVGTNLNATVSSRATQTSVDDIPTNAELATALTTLNDLSTGEVLTQVQTALATDTYAEPTAVPASTASLAAKIGWLMALARNRILQTATQQTLKRDDGTTNIATAAVSYDTVTGERSEWS